MKISWCRNNMAWSPRRWGFTLVEVLIVVAILALLVAVLVGVASSISTQRDTALTKNCLDILDAALAEFREITGHYPVDDWTAAITDSTCLIDGATKTPGTDDPGPSEVLYLQLSILPQTREIIAKLPDQLLTKPLDASDNLITVQLAGQSGNTPYLRRVVDAWGTPLEYTRDSSDPDDVFPTIASAGADPGTTEDDITNEG